MLAHPATLSRDGYFDDHLDRARTMDDLRAMAETETAGGATHWFENRVGYGMRILGIIDNPSDPPRAPRFPD